MSGERRWSCNRSNEPPARRVSGKTRRFPQEGLPGVVGTVFRVHVAESLRNQELHGLADQFGAGISEELFHLCVDFRKSFLRGWLQRGEFKQSLKQTVGAATRDFVRIFFTHITTPQVRPEYIWTSGCRRYRGEIHMRKQTGSSRIISHSSGARSARDSSQCDQIHLNA
jgi:hypothetical protein